MSMTKQEFMRHIAENIREYLPQSFEEAEISLQEVRKQNGTMQTGIIIRKGEENISPCIYLDEPYEEWKQGMAVEELLEKIADIRIQAENSELMPDLLEELQDYEKIKRNLRRRLCDLKESQEYLKEVEHNEHGDFGVEYRIMLENSEGEELSVAVTPQMLEMWGVSVSQLYEDVIDNEWDIGAILADLEEMADCILTGEEPQNLFTGDGAEADSFPTMYCLKNTEKMYGASLILQDEVLEKVGEVLRDNYYILPSSVYEVMIVPESAMITVDELQHTVEEINRAVVAPEDRLSNHVQYYDRQTGIMENALKREERMHQERMMKDPIKEILRRNAQKTSKHNGIRPRRL